MALKRHDYVDSWQLRDLEDNYEALNQQLTSIDKKFYNIETTMTKIEHSGTDNAMIENMFATHSAAFRKDFTALDDKCNLAIDGLNEMKDEVD